MLKDFDLWYISAGRGWFETSQGKFNIGPGDCLILRPGYRYTGRHDPSRPLSVTAVHFDYLDKRGKIIHPPSNALPRLHRKIRDTTFLHTLLQRIVSSLRENPLRQHQANDWLRAALLEIASRDREPSFPPHLQDQLQGINRLCEEISANPAEAYRIDELAQRAGYSPDHFARLFRKFKGISPGEFIIHCRLEAAKTLLHTSSHSITRIAELLGYSDVYFFSKQFHQKVHMTPSEFRGR